MNIGMDPLKAMHMSTNTSMPIFTSMAVTVEFMITSTLASMVNIRIPTRVDTVRGLGLSGSPIPLF
jgi:hypothetical protein